MKIQTMQRHSLRARRTDRIMTCVFYAVGGFFLLLLLMLAGYIIGKGFSGLQPKLLEFGPNGIGDQLFDTVYLVVLSLLISVPIGVAAGIYMAQYARPSRTTRFLRVCIEALSSLPSIVVGLFGYLVFILATGARWNLMAGAQAVSILSLPLIATTTEDALRALPRSYQEGSMSLGATRRQTIVNVLLPACFPRIITGIILAAGRGFGEAAALLYTAGQSVSINWSNWNLLSPACPLNPFRPGETLALHIWVLRTEGSLYENSAAMANLAAAILVLLVFGFSLLARLISRRIDRKSRGQ